MSRRLKCPPASQPDQLLEWLIAFGRRHPGHVLCPTSDDSAWLYSKHRGELCRYFHMYQPGLDAVFSLLNKRRLCDIARAEGIDFPPSWFPQSEGDLGAVLQQAQFPVLIKPVTQILHKTHSKGIVVDEPSKLAEFFLLMARDMYHPEILACDPTVVSPMVQEFQPTAIDGLYSMSGFIDESGTLLGVRATRKILQRPRRLGVGICFERAEVKPDLADAIVRICRRTGYHGVFEVEFIHRDGRELLIDFNPRFYGQMAFDIGRGLPLPLLAYHAALGQWRTVRALATGARQSSSDQTIAVHCNRIEFEIMLRAQRLSGRMNGDEVQAWHHWYDAHRGRRVDPIMDKDDWKPFVSEIAQQFLEHVKHPRASLRSNMMKAAMLAVDLRLEHL